MTSMIDYNGIIYPANEPLLKIIDNGFYYGFGIYETLYIKNGSVAFYEEHIQRLIRCADFFHIQFSESYIQTLKLRIKKLIRTENAIEGRFRLTFSTGTNPLDTDKVYSENISSCISIQKISIKIDSINLYISSYKKQYPSFFPSYVKYTANYPSILSFQEAIKNGYDEGLLLTQNNLISEGSFCNFFWIDEADIIKTPSLSSSILDGVTRSRLLEAATQIGLTVSEGEYDKNNLDTCKRAYISSSTRGLLPVKKLHNRNLDIAIPDVVARWMHQFEQLQEESLKIF